MKVKDIMSREVSKVTKDATLKEVSSLMKEFDIGFIIIAEDDKAIGVITDRDIVIRSLMEDGNKSVEEFMTKEAITIDADSDIEDALNVLAEYQINRLVVTSNDKVVGVLSISDILNSSFEKSIIYYIEEIKSPINVYVIDNEDIPDIEIDTFEL